jgi:hypothetical protein
MTENKKTDRINASGNLSARGFNFFTPRALRLLGALGNAQINSPRTLQHICKPPQANAQSKGSQKSCNFALAPHRFEKFLYF